MRGPRLLAFALLGLVGGGYVLIAWQLTPGFYDGFAPCPAEPYRWTSPPPEFRANNHPPASGMAEARVGTGGRVDPVTVLTADGQAEIDVPLPDTFRAPSDRSSVTIRLQPVESGFPPAAGIHVSTNVYSVVASAPLTGRGRLGVRLHYQQGMPAPSTVYFAPEGSSAWRPLDSSPSPANDCSVTATGPGLGHYALGYPTSSSGAGGPRIGGQLLPIIVAASILIVVLGGLPLALARRRGREGSSPPTPASPPTGDEVGDDPPPP